MILLLGVGMLVMGAMMWSVIKSNFGIADDINDVICISCVQYFTISNLVLAIGSAITILILIYCIAVKEDKLKLGVLIIAFYTLAGIVAIIIVTTAPIWLSRQTDIVQRFIDSSKSSFRKQLVDEDIRETWENYQYKFGCCGVQDYKDYNYIYWRSYSNSVPISCCNLTTVLNSVAIECSTVVKNVTDDDVSSYYIMEKGVLM